MKQNIPIIKIIHAKNNIYDVYINEQWEVSYGHIDNVL